MERMEAEDRWEFCQESQTHTSQRARQVAEMKDAGGRGDGWDALLPPVSRHFSAPADEGHGHTGRRNTNMVAFTGQALFYLFYVVSEKRHFYCGKN